MHRHSVYNIFQCDAKSNKLITRRITREMVYEFNRQVEGNDVYAYIETILYFNQDVWASRIYMYMLTGLRHNVYTKSKLHGDRVFDGDFSMKNIRYLYCKCSPKCRVIFLNNEYISLLSSPHEFPMLEWQYSLVGCNYAVCDVNAASERAWLLLMCIIDVPADSCCQAWGQDCSCTGSAIFTSILMLITNSKWQQDFNCELLKEAKCDETAYKQPSCLFFCA